MYFKQLGVILLLAYSLPSNSSDSTELLYKEHCALCHGFNRQGVSAPALLAQNLKRLKKDKAKDVIKNGRIATQMLGFSAKLKDNEIQALVDYIYTPTSFIPKWEMDDMSSSHKILVKSDSLPKKPVHDANLLNMFLVVESGDHHVSVLDGDKLEVIHRFKSHYALHGGPKFSPDGRFVYLASRDGWISKFDMYSLQIVAEIRAGINTRNIAVSGDGEFVMVANYLPHSLVLLNADNLQPIKIIPVINDKGESSRASAVYTAEPRKTFIVALKDFKQVWEINYEKNPPSGFGEWVHDYNKESGESEVKKFPIRKINIDLFLDDFFFDQDYIKIIGASRQGKGRVIDLDLGRIVADLDLSGMPHLSSGITWKYKDKMVLATPDLKKAQISIFDMQSWKIIKRIKTQGSGFFMRSHKNSRYAWADVFFGKHKDKVHIIDKQTLSIVKTLQPIENKTSAHVEFTKDGKYALLSIWENDGYVIVYDADTHQEIKRLPMNKPVGKYNVYNKITRDEGTSH